MENRKNFYAKIKYNDWDMIVVPQSVFERIPDSEERQMAYIQDKIDEKLAVLEQMKEAGMWFACADMGGESMYRSNLTGPLGLVIGNEGEGVSRLVREHCDMIVSIPMKGDIDSLNASVAAGVLAFEVVRQKMSR